MAQSIDGGSLVPVRGLPSAAARRPFELPVAFHLYVGLDLTQRWTLLEIDRSQVGAPEQLVEPRLVRPQRPRWEHICEGFIGARQHTKVLLE